MQISNLWELKACADWASQSTTLFRSICITILGWLGIWFERWIYTKCEKCHYFLHFFLQSGHGIQFQLKLSAHYFHFSSLIYSHFGTSVSHLSNVGHRNFHITQYTNFPHSPLHTLNNNNNFSYKILQTFSIVDILIIFPFSYYLFHLFFEFNSIFQQQQQQQPE